MGRGGGLGQTRELAGLEVGVRWGALDGGTHQADDLQRAGWNIKGRGGAMSVRQGGRERAGWRLSGAARSFKFHLFIVFELYVQGINVARKRVQDHSGQP